MMSTQMNNCRHVGFQSWESQTCETLAFQEEKKQKKTHPSLSTILFLSFSLHLSSFPLAFILSLLSDGCRLVGMLTLDARLKKIALRKQLTLDTPSEPLSEKQTAGLCSALSFIICSIAHRVHYVWRGTCVSAPRAKASATDWGPQGNQGSHWRAESLLFARQLPTQVKDQRRNKIRQSGLV